MWRHDDKISDTFRGLQTENEPLLPNPQKIPVAQSFPTTHTYRQAC